MYFNSSFAKSLLTRVFRSSIVSAKGGYGYCEAFVNGYSRKVMSMKVSNTLSSEFCVEALREAAEKHETPEVIHTDRGKQFVGKEFTDLLKGMKIKLSVSENGFKGNLLIERGRTYKYEFVYLWDGMELKEIKEKTKEWMGYYSSKRQDQALGYKTSDEVYYYKQRRSTAA